MRWGKTGAVLSMWAISALLFAQSQPPLSGGGKSVPDQDSKVIPLDPEPSATLKNGDSQVLEDVLVTGTKREAFEREIPESVGSINGRLIEGIGAQSLNDYLTLIPGVSFNSQGTEASVPIIRGIATESGFGTTGQPVGLYVDDMPFADLFLPLSLPDLNPFDLERVEVLKGPQGTLFGSGALSGAVRYVTTLPQLGVLGGRIMTTVHRSQASGGPSGTWAGAINLPLGNEAAFRGVAIRRSSPGTYDMSAGDLTGSALRDSNDADDLSQTTFRGAATWQLTTRLHLSAGHFAQRSSFADSPIADQRQMHASSINPFPSPRAYRFGGTNLSATYDFDSTQLIYSGNALRKDNRVLTHSEWFFSLENQNQTEWYDLAQSRVRGVTHEVRLLSAPSDPDENSSWLVGAAWLRYGNEYFQYEPLPGPRSPPPSGPDDVSTAERADSFLFATVDSVGIERAFFGQVTVPFLKRWEGVLGIRAYRTDLTADTVLSGVQTTALTQRPEQRASFAPSSRGVNPKLGLRYSLTDRFSLHALATRGFQFGGVQVNPSTPALEGSAAQAGFSFGPYRSSDLWSYEGGFRSRWLDDRLQIDVTGFWIDWSDLQLTVRVPIAATSATFGLIANVGRAHSAGLETSVRSIPFQNAEITVGITSVRAVTDVPFDDSNPEGPIAAGTRLPGTPELQYSTQVSYEWTPERLDGWSLTPSAKYLFVGSSPDALRRTEDIGGYSTVDLGLTLSNLAARYRPQIRIAVTNVTNVSAATYHNKLASITTGEAYDFYHLLEPRTFLTSLSLDYY